MGTKLRTTLGAQCRNEIKMPHIVLEVLSQTVMLTSCRVTEVLNPSMTGEALAHRSCQNRDGAPEIFQADMLGRGGNRGLIICRQA